MNKFFGLVIVLSLVLSGFCKYPEAPNLTSATAAVTMPGISMRQLYEKYFTNVSETDEIWVGSAVMKVIALHDDNMLEVTINGNPELIIRSECSDCNNIYYFCGYRDSLSGPYSFEEFSLFEDWWNTSKRSREANSEFYIFPTGIGYEGLTIYLKSVSPTLITDASKWEGNKTTLDYPEHPDRMTVNVNTGEMIVGVTVLAIDDNHQQWYFYPKARLWGYVHYETSKYYHGGKLIVVTESRPDPEVFERSRKYTEENFPEETYRGPFDTCKELISDRNFKNEKNNLVSEIVSEEEMIFLCDVYYSKDE